MADPSQEEVSQDEGTGIQLPLATDTVPADAGAGESEDELGEEDLFGSEGEDQEAPTQPVSSAASAADPMTPTVPATAASAAAGSGTPASGTPASATPAVGADRVGLTSPVPDEKELFGEDSDAENELDEKALFGSEEEGGAEIDERELFGSEDEDGAKADKGQPGTPAKSDMSEMDERDIFGDVSDEEVEKAEDIILRRRPAPSEDRTFVSMRLPNVLSVDKTAFNPDFIPAAMMEGYKAFQNTLNKKATRLLNPENCIRWRFKKGQDGHNLTDEDGRPQYESNARFVEWEDGSKTLFVGKEAFNILDIDTNVYLFEENSQDVHVCHGYVKKRFVPTPTTLSSATHASLKKSQFKTFEPNRRSILMSQEEQDANRALQELQMEHKQRQRRDEQRQKRNLEAGADQMTAAFLEDDQPLGVGPSLMDIKQAHKKQRSG
jgi:RNA polymerase-associated protein LEO1